MRTHSGGDWQAGVMADTANTGNAGNQYAPANYLGLTADTTAPAATDTSLPGEISSGTLVRTQATYAHTTGTSSYTLTNLFTSDQSVAVAKVGVFNAASSGTLVFEDLFEISSTPAPAQLYSGDQLLVVETVSF